MNQYSQNSLLEAAVAFLRESEDKKIQIEELLDAIVTARFAELAPEHLVEIKTRLYTDIITSAKFVFLSKTEIGLKENFVLKEYDKDGSEFYDRNEEFEEDDDQRTGSRFEDDMLEENEDEDDNVTYDGAGREIKEVDEDEESNEDYDDEDYSDDEDYDDDYDDDYNDVSDDLLDSAEEFDEDKYNEYMDEYEDQYDD